eukprot:279031_1
MLPRTIRKLTPSATKLASKSTLLTPIITINNQLNNSIHTKKLPKKQSSNQRLFSAIPLPSLTSSISPKAMTESMTESINMLTGNTTQISKNDRIMQRVWEKRKQRLFKATNNILEKFQTKNIKFQTAEIYIRKAGSFDDDEDNNQREVHIALRGIAHTVVVLKCGTESYLLDRVVEGIRLTELSMNNQMEIEKCNKFKPEEMVKLSTFNNINISSNVIAEWINKESQTQYNVIRNNCVQFSFYFYQHFLYGMKIKQLINQLK